MARAGVDERGDHGMARASSGETGLELRLPGVERGAALAVARLVVGDVVRAADEAVDRVEGGPALSGQAAHGPVVRRVTAALHAARTSCTPRMTVSSAAPDTYHVP